MLPIRTISYLLPLCCSFWEKFKNSPKSALGCSTPLMSKMFLKSKLIRVCRITCTKILVLWLVESHSLFQLFIASGDKTSHCTPFGSARMQKLFTIDFSVHITLECSVFSIQSSDVCSKTRLMRKSTCETLRGANEAGALRAFSLMQAYA